MNKGWFYLFLFFCLALLIVGGLLVVSKNVFTGTTTASVLHGECKRSVLPQGNNMTDFHYDCTLWLEYIIDEKKYTNTLSTSSPLDYSLLKTIQIEYDKRDNDPMKIRLPKAISNRGLGIILMAIAVIIFLFVGLAPSVP